MDGRDQPHCTLFVSYAHEDRKMVEELRKPFIPLERRYGCKLFWDDSRIRAGDGWRQQIHDAMTQARFAVLLLSSDFLVSDFIHAEELPRLLERQRAGGLTILPMLVGPVDLGHSALAELQFVNPPGQPLKKLKPVEREECFLQVADRVKALLLQAEEHAGAAEGDAAGYPPQASAPDEAHGDPADGAPRATAAADEAGTASWTASIPPHMALAEVENQLGRLKRHTRTRGFAVFDRDGYYVQFDYYAQLDDSSVVVEAQSNAYLQGARRLSRVQLSHLTDVLQFSQASADENLLMYAPLDSEQSIAQLARITWHVLTEVYPCLDDSALSITAQCR